MNDFGGICIPLMIMGYHVCHGDWVIIARPGGFGSLPMSTGQVASLTASPGEISDRLPMCSAGTFPGGPCYSSLGGPQQPPVGLVSTSASVRASVQAPTMQNCPPKPPFSELFDELDSACKIMRDWDKVEIMSWQHNILSLMDLKS